MAIGRPRKEGLEQLKERKNENNRNFYQKKKKIQSNLLMKALKGMTITDTLPLMKEFLGSPRVQKLINQVKPESSAELITKSLSDVLSQLPKRSEHRKPILSSMLQNMRYPLSKGHIQSRDVANQLGVTPSLLRKAKQVDSKVSSVKCDLFTSSKISHSKKEDPFLQKVVEKHIQNCGGHKSGASTLTYLISMKKEALYLDFRENYVKLVWHTKDDEDLLSQSPRMSREVALIAEGIVSISPCIMFQKRKKKLAISNGQPDEETEPTAVFDGVSGDSAICLEAFMAKRIFKPLDKKSLEKLSKFSNTQSGISAFDWDTLKPGKSVSDEVVRVYFLLLQQRARSLKLPIAYLGPEFMIKYDRTGTMEEAAQWIPRYFKDARFRQCDFQNGVVIAAVLIPAKEQIPGHYYIIEIKFKDLKVRGYESFYPWDDFRNQGVQRLGKALSLFVTQANVKDWISRVSEGIVTCEVIESPRESSAGMDCGLYAMRLADYLSFGGQVTRDIFNDIDMSTLYRKRVECDLNLASITYSTTFLDLGKKSKQKVAPDVDDVTRVEEGGWLVMEAEIDVVDTTLLEVEVTREVVKDDYMEEISRCNANSYSCAYSA